MTGLNPQSFCRFLSLIRLVRQFSNLQKIANAPLLLVFNSKFEIIFPDEKQYGFGKTMETLTDQIGHYAVDRLQVDGGHHPFDNVYLTH